MGRVGIGATVKACALGGFLVTAIAAHASSRNHLRAGDRIVSIDGQSTLGLTLARMRELMLGEAASAVRIEIVRGIGSGKKHLTVTFERMPSSMAAATPSPLAGLAPPPAPPSPPALPPALLLADDAITSTSSPPAIVSLPAASSCSLTTQSPPAASSSTSSARDNPSPPPASAALPHHAESAASSAISPAHRSTLSPADCVQLWMSDGEALQAIGVTCPEDLFGLEISAVDASLLLVPDAAPRAQEISEQLSSNGGEALASGRLDPVADSAPIAALVHVPHDAAAAAQISSATAPAIPPPALASPDPPLSSSLVQMPLTSPPRNAIIARCKALRRSIRFRELSLLIRRWHWHVELESSVRGKVSSAKLLCSLRANALNCAGVTIAPRIFASHQPLQIWQSNRLLARRHFKAWRELAIELLDLRCSDSAAAAAPAASPLLQPDDPTTRADSTAPSPHPHPPHSPAPHPLLSYFNAWFQFANVLQWSRDLQLEHDHSRMKSAFAAWKISGSMRRSRAPLSPNSAAAAGVKSLMPQSPPQARRQLRSAQPSDVAVSFDLFNSSPPAPPAAHSHRPTTRRLISPDDSARIMFFFGMFFPPLLVALIWKLRDQIEMGVWRRYSMCQPLSARCRPQNRARISTIFLFQGAF